MLENFPFLICGIQLSIWYALFHHQILSSILIILYIVYENNSYIKSVLYLPGMNLFLWGSIKTISWTANFGHVSLQRVLDFSRLFSKLKKGGFKGPWKILWKNQILEKDRHTQRILYTFENNIKSRLSGNWLINLKMKKFLFELKLR